MISTDIQLAAQFLNNEGIVGIPTETVYGLAANAFSERAILKIFDIKQRPTSNPLILHIKNYEELKNVGTDIPEMAHQLAKTFWPGPLTLLVKKQKQISNLVTADQNTVAVRVPNHPLTLELLHSIAFPLVAPSANPFTRISPTKAIHVDDYFDTKIDMVLDGGSCSAGVESTIVGFDQNQVIVYRLGAISIEEIEKITGNVTLLQSGHKKTTTPGMFKKHYAPTTKIILTSNIQQELNLWKDMKIGVLAFQQALQNVPLTQQKILSPEGDLKIATANLYNSLHELDSLNLDLIIAERFPDEGLGRTLNDRLTRATQK
jgi:L-threonylcarbamoyladenylate synthase